MKNIVAGMKVIKDMDAVSLSNPINAIPAVIKRDQENNGIVFNVR